MCDIIGCSKEGEIFVNQYTYVCKPHYEMIRDNQIKWNKQNPDKPISVWETNTQESQS